MPVRLVGGDLFIQHANRRFIAADFDAVRAIPVETERAVA
jgi:hypothetical protein